MNYLKLINKIAKGPVKPIIENTYNAAVKTRLRKHLPIGNIFIEVSSVCNLQCPGCYHTINKYSAKNKIMKLESFKKYLDQLPQAYRLTLSGLGEPTLNPDIIEMVKYAHNTKKFNLIGFTTNLLAKEPTIYDHLFSNGLSYLFVSVDSLDQEQINTLRTGTDIKVLIKNINYLTNKYADKITANIVVNNINIQTIKKTITNLSELGIKSIKLQPFEDNGDSSRCLSRDEEKIYFDLLEEMKTEGIRQDSRFDAKKRPCYSPYQSALVTVDGYVTPCCRIVNKDIFNLGHLDEIPFKDIFYSKKVDAIQKNIEKGNYPSFCKGCLLNHVEFNKNH